MPNILKIQRDLGTNNLNLSNVSLNSEKDIDGKYSIVMVGCGGVGKSSITLRFVYDEFEEFYDPTKADSYRRRLKDSKGNILEIDILDTAGQEEYAAIRDNYYRSGEGFILVYSITDKSSFTALTDFRSQILRSLNDPNPPLLLLGNKSDLNRFRTVSKNEGIIQANNWNCKFREASAKLDEGVIEAFIEISEFIDKKRSEKEILAKNKDKTKKSKFRLNRNKCIIQ